MKMISLSLSLSLSVSKTNITGSVNHFALSNQYTHILFHTMKNYLLKDPLNPYYRWFRQSSLKFLSIFDKFAILRTSMSHGGYYKRSGV